MYYIKITYLYYLALTILVYYTIKSSNNLTHYRYLIIYQNLVKYKKNLTFGRVGFNLKKS